MIKTTKDQQHGDDPTAGSHLIDRWIDPESIARRVDAAWLVGSAVPVWALIGYLDAVGSDLQQVARDYDVPLEAAEAAIAFYRCHKILIDARIAASALN